MFWTFYGRSGSLWRSWMDGSNANAIVTGLDLPLGITIDFQDSCLYWVTRGDDKVWSSDMQGQKARPILQRSGYPNLVGIGVLGQRIYWTEMYTANLQSSTKAGSNIRLLHTGTSGFHRLAIIPRPDLPANGTNRCENRHCSGVCVLVPNSFRCLA